MCECPCPDPTVDFEGYLLWGELHACRTCEGTGECTGDDDIDRGCLACQGSGIDPEFWDQGADDWDIAVPDVE